MLDRVRRAMNAVGNAASAIAGRTPEAKDSQRATGKRWSLRQKKYCKKLERTKLGTETPIVEMTIAAVSCHWLCLMAAIVPRKMPLGTARHRAARPSVADTGNASAINWVTLLP